MIFLLFCDYGVDGVREGRWGTGSRHGRSPGSEFTLVRKYKQLYYDHH